MGKGQGETFKTKGTDARLSPTSVERLRARAQGEPLSPPAPQSQPQAKWDFHAALGPAKICVLFTLSQPILLVDHDCDDVHKALGA